MIQKKICMVGVYATGKTSLVRRFVHSRFSDKYLTTVGVKIDRKVVELPDQTVNMVLWDVEGRTTTGEVPASYLRGAHGFVFVADGTRAETLAQIPDLWQLAKSVTGVVPAVLAVNKVDLADRWQIHPADLLRLREEGWYLVKTSAKSGEGVEQAFQWLAARTAETDAPSPAS